MTNLSNLNRWTAPQFGVSKWAKNRALRNPTIKMVNRGAGICYDNREGSVKRLLRRFNEVPLRPMEVSKRWTTVNRAVQSLLSMVQRRSFKMLIMTEFLPVREKEKEKQRKQGRENLTHSRSCDKSLILRTWPKDQWLCFSHHQLVPSFNL